MFDNQETPAGRVQVCPCGRRAAAASATSRPRGARRAAWSHRPGRRRDRRRAGRRRSRPAPTSRSAGRASCATSRPGERVTRRAPAAVGAARAGRPRRGEPPRRRLRDERRDARAGSSIRAPTCSSPRATSGGLLIRVGDDGPREALRYLPTATDRETDPTGAGDTFLAALLASVLRPAIVGRHRSRRSPDLRFAAAAGSLAVEGPGLSGGPGSRGRARPARARARPPGGHPERGLAGRGRSSR